MARTSTGSYVSTEDGASPITSPVTGKRTAMTARMRPWSGAVSNNNKENTKKKGDFYSAHLPHEVGAQGQCMHRVWGLPEVMHRKHSVQYSPGSAVWFPVAHRIYTCLAIRILRLAFQDAGSVSSGCFVC